ncbi:MAG: sel1 repeat family protein [Burkholderiales bacterium]|nr:MAG: sel1 repeat family protein [Burkholderiales bacterium]
MMKIRILALASLLTSLPCAIAQSNSNYDRAQAAFDLGNYDASIRLLSPLAQAGEPASNALIGYAYLKRLSSPNDVSDAMSAFRKAAVAGSASAQFMLGFFYSNGHYGYDKDETEAAKWALSAARQGVADSQSLIGFYYAAGMGGLEKSSSVAVCWFRRAASQGDAGAQYNLGRAISIGEGAPEDYAEGYKWLNLAARQGIEKAVDLRDALKPLLTSAQLAEAQRASTNWRSSPETREPSKQNCN